MQREARPPPSPLPWSMTTRAPVGGGGGGRSGRRRSKARHCRRGGRVGAVLAQTGGAAGAATGAEGAPASERARAARGPAALLARRLARAPSGAGLERVATNASQDALGAATGEGQEERGRPSTRGPPRSDVARGEPA